MEKISQNPEQTYNFGLQIADTVRPGSVVILTGPLGAGKTIIAKGIAEGLGITEQVTSPSFSIVSEYQGNLNMRHIDLYRTGSDEELELMGFGELTSGSAVSIIEWGEKAKSFLNSDELVVEITIEKDLSRKMKLTGPPKMLEQLQ
ncbi:MAG: tRNA (adenosine(37)-N6)-threonylcarbamoyltransferase complex ATPase subunit type 1 TsaE [Spirochaetales bacterium]|jgi:tRNA threonylcarbamoyladenosine biosynthesis protein TsaE|nr:tRNA (adenosine(37)-N6)-threonylcarbamoyltransferase complex ATPase subunit type 1 TsaE [Spirochaetales bacterium]